MKAHGRLLKPIFFFCLLSLACPFGYAQTQPAEVVSTVTLDLSTRQFNATLPFGVPFKIKASIPEKIDSVYVRYGVQRTMEKTIGVDADGNKETKWLPCSGNKPCIAIIQEADVYAASWKRPRETYVKANDFVIDVEVPLLPDVHYRFEFELFGAPSASSGSAPKKYTVNLTEKRVGILEKRLAGNIEEAKPPAASKERARYGLAPVPGEDSLWINNPGSVLSLAKIDKKYGRIGSKVPSGAVGTLRGDMAYFELGGRQYVASGPQRIGKDERFVVVDVTDLSNPQVVSMTESLGQHENPHGAGFVAFDAQNNRLVVMSTNNRIASYDLPAGSPMPPILTAREWKIDPGDRAWFKNDNQNKNTTRGGAYNPVTGHLLVVSRVGGLQVRRVEADDGSDLSRALNVTGITGVTGVTHPLSEIAVTSDGQIFGASMTVGAPTFPLRIYRWKNETDAPELVFEGSLAGPYYGSNLSVSGEGNDVMIYLSSTGEQDRIAQFKWSGSAPLSRLNYARMASDFVTIPDVMHKSSFKQHFDEDFGVGVMLSNPSGYVGVVSNLHFYFVPINKNEDLLADDGKAHKARRLKSRFSVFLGLALQEIYTSRPIDNLFTIGSPVFGIGIRGPLYIFKQSRKGKKYLQPMRLNIGLMRFQQATANPIISEKRKKTGLFVSLTVDLELKDIIGPLASFFN